MALHTFGGTPADVLTTVTGDVVPDYPLVVRRAGTGETLTALYEVDGVTPIGQLRSNASSHASPGAIRPFKVDADAIDYEYLDAEGDPVRWYQAGRELAADASQDAQEALDGLTGKLDKSGGTITGNLTITGTLTAPGFSEGTAGLYPVSDAVGDGTTDDRAVIQAALDAARDAGGGIVLIPGGRTYGVSTFLVVYANTVIWAYGATLKAIGNAGLLRNFVTGETFAGYAGRSHIQIVGGTWDGNAADAGVGTVTAETDVINFVHCSDITVRDATIKNTSTAHALEFNSTDGGRAINCRILGFKDNSVGAVRQFSEGIQIDIAKSGSSSIGDFDNTPAKNILIQGCYFGPSERLGVFGRAVGSHTAAAGVTFDNIQALGNRVDGALQEGIYGFGWRRSVIADNVITGCGMSGISAAMYDYSSIATSPHTLAIHGNTVEGSASDSGIRVVGDTGYKMPGVSITGNVVRDITGNAIHTEHCSAPDISGNQCDDTSSTGIYAHLSDGAVVNGNVMKNAGSNGINVSGTIGACVTGNMVDTTATNFGIFVGQSGSTDSTDALVSGNSVVAAASAGIRCSTDAARCTITGNKVRKGGGATVNGITLAASAVDCTVTDNDLSGNAWAAATALVFSTANPTTGPGAMTAIPGSNLVDGDLTALPPLEAAMRPAGRFESTSRVRCGTSSTPTSGTLYLVPIWLPKGAVISNLGFVSVTGITSPTNWWFMLCDSARVAVARTANQTTTAWASNTAKTVAIAQTTAGAASTYTTTYTGLHYVGIMYTGSALTLMSEGTMAQLGDLTPAFGASNTSQTTPPTVTSGAFTAAAPTGAAICAYAYAT